MKIAVAVSTTLAVLSVAGCDSTETATRSPTQKSITLVRPGDQPIQAKTLHSSDRQEEADRELIRQFIADRQGVQVGEVKWTHHQYEPLTMDSQSYVDMMRRQGKTDEQIKQRIAEQNETRYVELQAAGRKSQAYSIYRGEVKQVTR